MKNLLIGIAMIACSCATATSTPGSGGSHSTNGNNSKQAEFEAVPKTLEFNSKQFQLVFEDNNGHSSIHEYLTGSETLEKWTQMFTIGQHTTANEIKDVLKPYMAQKKDMLALEPLILSNEQSTHQQDIVVFMILLAPDKSFYEAVVYRVVSDPGKGVKTYAYSYRFPFSENADVSQVMENRMTWIQFIGSMEV